MRGALSTPAPGRPILHLTTMDAEEIRLYFRRWRKVRERELVELRSTPLDVKLVQLAALMQSARSFGWETTTPAEVEAVRRRWNQLRDALRA